MNNTKKNIITWLLSSIGSIILLALFWNELFIGTIGYVLVSLIVGGLTTLIMMFYRKIATLSIMEQVEWNRAKVTKHIL